ncbi:uncharacterized protein LOC120332715 [Styela clava]
MANQLLYSRYRFKSNFSFVDFFIHRVNEEFVWEVYFKPGFTYDDAEPADFFAKQVWIRRVQAFMDGHSVGGFCRRTCLEIPQQLNCSYLTSWCELLVVTYRNFVII